ncbi:hypothetical protein [Kribbella italica]|uniref:Uncharacterized protein n=1 Tax=Kribbella italica TaxID=1540520 RepID=A0A7W9JGE0_9ACTN|nr:hypothetical protein [Kribbella italica]MBB5841661.1 hypothetical protein [Kribbella italica]
MTVELQKLLTDAAASNWAPGPSERLAEGIEERIIAFLPSRARAALGAEEAAQRARVIAWERCRLLAERSRGTANWGFLANAVRWRLADAVRAETLRRQRHPLTDFVPERVDRQHVMQLGPLLDLIAAELAGAGLSERTARRLLLVATEGSRFERSAIRDRLMAAGTARSQAEGLAWLLRGGAANRSAVARLATGELREEVFADAVVRRWTIAAAGRDQTFSGGRTGRGLPAVHVVETPGFGLARTA